MSVALERSSSALARILAAKRFGVNVLGHAQHDLAMMFAGRSADRFAEAVKRYPDGTLAYPHLVEKVAIPGICVA